MFRSLFVSGLLTCNGSCSESICPCKPLRSCLRFLAVCYGVGYAVHVYILVVYLSMNWASSLVPHIPFPQSKPLLTNIGCKRSHIIEGEVRLWCWHCGFFFFFFWGGGGGFVERWRDLKNDFHFRKVQPICDIGKYGKHFPENILYWNNMEPQSEINFVIST